MIGEAHTAAPVAARRIELRGIVQGVGLRPRVWRLAQSCAVTGRVFNAGTAAVIEAFGTAEVLARFEAQLRGLSNGGLRIDEIRSQPLDATRVPPAAFAIDASATAQPGLGVAPDWASCTDCVAETLDPFSRRYRYPFTACTRCGPRLSVFRQTPYDRSHTTMAGFPLCTDCRREYENPDDRRFHAQAMACHACGPRASLKRLDGRPFALDALSFLDDVDAACSLIGKGEIVLVKGLGGYQLACDATNQSAVQRLRALKQRDAKPFALLMRDLDMLQAWCEADAASTDALISAAAPIALLPRCPTPPVAERPLADGIAPGLATLGVMLPSTPLHHLLMRRRRAPVVLTSGNLSAEPQAITLDEAAARLGHGVDWVLDHDRPIERRVDDSVGRSIGGRFRLLRRARGHAPAPMALPPGFAGATRVLALGGDLKNTFALLHDGQAVLSQHMGDLHDTACRDDQARALADYLRFHAFEPDLVACDRHPGYASTQQAGRDWPGRSVQVGHHHAHVVATMGEHAWPLDAGPVLGIALDGLGLGDDGQLWGGEFLRADYCGAERIGTFKPVPLPGGDLAAREPWRNTYAQLMAEMGWPRFAMNYAELELFAFLDAQPRALLDAALRNPALAPPASSVGRLFDAVAAAVGVCRERVAYEGEAAMRLESLVTPADLDEDSELDYPFAIPRLDKGRGLPYVEPLAMWQALLGDLILRTPAPRIAARFHRGLANVIVKMALQLAERHILHTVALGGGVFANRVLAERVLQGLQAAGLQVLMPCALPAGDGGLAFGQGLVALARHLRLPAAPTGERACA